MEIDNVKMEQVPFDIKKPSEIYVALRREPNPMGPPDSYEVKASVDFQNFPDPLMVLNALDIAKATVINLMQQQQKLEVQKNPGFKKPPWARS